MDVTEKSGALVDQQLVYHQFRLSVQIQGFWHSSWCKTWNQCTYRLQNIVQNLNIISNGKMLIYAYVLKVENRDLWWCNAAEATFGGIVFIHFSECGRGPSLCRREISFITSMVNSPQCHWCWLYADINPVARWNKGFQIIMMCRVFDHYVWQIGFWSNIELALIWSILLSSIFMCVELIFQIRIVINTVPSTQMCLCTRVLNLSDFKEFVYASGVIYFITILSLVLAGWCLFCIIEYRWGFMSCP